MTSYDTEDAIVVTEPTEINVEPSDSTTAGSRGVSGPVVNNAAKDSETPSNLVGKGEGKELSPNPEGFGFTKQLFVDSLPDSGQLVNTLYLLTVKNNGVLVGYKKYKWTPTDGYVLLSGATPDLKVEDGPREQKAIENTTPSEEPEKVFNGLVVFNKEPKIKGEDLSEYINKKGGVTEQELKAYVKANPTLAGTESALEGIEVDGVKFKVPQEKPNELPTLPTEDGTYTLKVTVSGDTKTLSWVADSDEVI